jgi:putative DNA methylase
MTEFKRKLIEVALPLDAINLACRSETENPFLQGHPRSLAVYWARLPLVACRALIFGSLVDDPSADPDRYPTEDAQDRERQRLFAELMELVKWENSANDRVLSAARSEILKSCDGELPAIYDPFCGRGSIPLEAQRIGLQVYASDLNPVAVLISKALVEIPPVFAGRPPVNRAARPRTVNDWTAALGMSEDIRHYGQWMRDEAKRRIGAHYPRVKLPPEHGGGDGEVIAWIWARTVKSPNPAWDGHVPLVRSFALSSKPGKESWIQPSVDRTSRTISYAIRSGPGCPAGTVNRNGATCLATGTAIPFDYVRAEGKAGRIGTQLMAIVAEGRQARVYLPPNDEHLRVARASNPGDVPNTDLPEHALGFRVQGYGMTKHRDLFTDRQLLALGTFSDLIRDARELVHSDALAAGLGDNGVRLADGGNGASAYADAIAVYLALSVSRLTDYSCSLATWNPTNENVSHLFQRQAVPMAWDFAEANLLGPELSPIKASRWVADGLRLTAVGRSPAKVVQADAASMPPLQNVVGITDPPYYDNIGYGDLSDFFYVWLRKSLAPVFPDLFATLLVPKDQELVATPYRFGGDKDAARDHFQTGLADAFLNLRSSQNPAFPAVVIYAFKQAESVDDGDAETTSVSTGWETMLTAMIDAGLAVTGTWPLRTSKKARSVARGTNALASAIAIICRPRSHAAPLATRKEFLSQLQVELPRSLRRLQQGNVAPVDLAQSAIGPGMAVFSRFAKVVEADGSAMTVRTALASINQVLDATLAEQEGEFDADTRWAVAWFEQFGMNPASYGIAETLSKAKNSAVNALVDARIVEAKAGKVTLLGRDRFAENWDPVAEQRVTVWEVTQRLIRALETGGDAAAASIAGRVGGLAETARDLAYRLYNICERKGWSKEAISYNGLVVAWPGIARLAAGESGASIQLTMDT